MPSADATRSRQAALFQLQRPFWPVQWTAVLGSLAVLTWSVPGLIAGAAHYFAGERGREH